MLSGHGLRRRNGRWVVLVAIVAIGTLILGVIAVAGPFGDVTLPNEEETLPSAAIGQAIEANGFQIELIEARLSTDETILHLIVSRDTGPISAETLLPIRTQQIDTTNVMGDPADFGSTVFYDSDPNEGTLGIDLVIGPVKDLSQDVTVTLSELGVRQPSGEYQAVSGPWQFAFNPKEIGLTRDAEGVRTITVNHTAKSDGIAIEVSKVQISKTSTTVHYSVPGLSTGKFMPMEDTLRLGFPDGTTHLGTPTSASDPNGERIIRFPALPERAQSFTLQFGSFIVAKDGLAQVTLDIPAAFTTAEPLSPIAVDKTFTLDGQKLRVSTIGYEVRHDGAVIVTVGVEQVAADGTISLAGPQSSATLVDNLGNRYRASGGSMSANESSFSFEGPLDPNATSLTLEVHSYGEFVDNPEPITIDVPRE